MTNVVRLEERMNSHEDALKRYGSRLDEHALRLHDTEIWQATNGDKRILDRAVNSLTTRVDTLEGYKDTVTGQKGIYKEIVKWILGIFAAIVIWKATGK